MSVFPYVKHHGLVLVHDTLHSYVGEQMREGLNRALSYVRARERIDVESVTLPYGFGLTLMRVFNAPQTPVEITRRKEGSVHVTQLRDVHDVDA